MNNLHLLSIAQVEYRETTTWYLIESSPVAERFVAEVEAAFESILRNPTQHLKWDERYRYFIVKGFPYYIPYRIEIQDIIVVAVFHTSRDSSAWANR